MIRIPRSLRVALAGTAAVATIAAGASALLAPSAGAVVGDATTLSIEAVYPTDGSASAGTCTIYRAIPKTGLGAIASDSGTVVITLKENPNSSSQDVDFCVPPAAPDGQSGTRVDHGYYRNAIPSGPPASSSTRKSYCAGESITPPLASACTVPNTPDDASNDSLTTNPFVGDTTNPSGTDFVDDVRYQNDVPNGQFIEFGVAGLVPVGATIDACIDRSGSAGVPDKKCVASDGDIIATQASLTFSSGGLPDSIQAYDAVTNIQPDRTSYSTIQNPPTPASIDLTLLNSNADTVFGVIPNFRVQSGPNASGTIRNCTRSTDFGRSNCQYPPPANVGTDTLLIWVNHSGTGATAGPDPGEPTATVTVTTFSQPAPASSARNIDLTPNTPTSTTAGQSKVFTAFVTDASGTPVQGAQVTFSETGPGTISGGQSPDGNTSSLNVLTGPDGRASITITTQPGESGNETVTASISPNTTQCGALFNGQAGTCSDSTVNTISGGPSPSPSASASATATATATSTASASPTGSPSQRILTLRTSTPDIQPNQTGVLDAFGSTNSTVELRCYSRPSTTYFTARTGTTSVSGDIQFRILPGTNTRCFVRYTGTDTNASNSVVINVHTTLSLSTVRNGVRNYTFQGRNLPRRSGQLITLYRIDSFGREIRTSNLITDASGIYRVTRQFTGSGTFRFRVRTSANLTNAAGVSNTITVRVF